MIDFFENYFTAKPIGMNLRNHVIQFFNPQSSLLLAKDKLATKKLLSGNGVLMPRSYFEISKRADLKLMENFPKEFVLKPSCGHGGNGILVLERKNDGYFDPAGNEHSLRDIRRQLLKILDGEFSGFREKDIAIVEERLYPSPKIVFKHAAGLPDIRIFCINYVPTMAMLRYATKETNGRANLSMGAIGIAIDIETGEFTHLHRKKENEKLSFADFGISSGFIMPKWEEMKKTAIKASQLSSLKLSGVDLILDKNDRVMVLEINGRPGIEIQNINEKSLLEKLEKIEF
ncbi:MAG: sugar-transfer associated ATP-grasp domain-containing protein [Candidatus Moranbacteria bacterium]|nr:sugar-transfer associated ATP-grasp domain-containing protein [Candidatus Moranbacteria bacterium]